MFRPDWRRFAALAFCGLCWAAAAGGAARVVKPDHPSLRRAVYARAKHVLHRLEAFV